jgi:hypothetical protein
MSNNSQTKTARPAAVPVGGSSPRPKWLLPLLLSLLALIAASLLLARCGSDDAKKSTASTTAAPTSASPADSAPVTAEQGTVTAAGTNLLGAANVRNLSSNNGERAVGRGVKVQSVPADEGFWVGPSERDRLWVQLTGTHGESEYKVRESDTVDFSGTVTRVGQGYATKAGVTGAEGADQLTEQGFYLSVPASGVKLSR